MASEQDDDAPLLPDPLAGEGAQTMEFAPEDDPEAPPLIVSNEEPPPVSSVAPEALHPDAATLKTLSKLAGQGGDPEKARRALHAALRGEAFDRMDLPDARMMVVGLARAMVESGQSPDALVEAIAALLDE